MGKPKKKKKDRGSKQFLIAIWVVVLFLCVVSFFSIRGCRKKASMKSAASVSSIKSPKNITQGISGTASPQFNEALIKKGKVESKQAQDEGQSYMPPITNGEQSNPEEKITSVLKRKAKRHEEKEVLKVKTDPVSNAPSPIAKKRSPKRSTNIIPKAQIDDRVAQEMKASIKAQIAEISNKMGYIGHTITIYEPIAKNETMSTQNPATATASSNTPAKNSFNMVRDIGIRPGEVFYSENEQTLNTDTPAPVATVKLLSGPLKNSIAEGTFELQGEAISFKFYQLTRENGDKYKMVGFAVDPATRFAGVASEVDHHYLSRWGGLAAASFLEGWKSAVENSGTSTTSNVSAGIITQENPAYSLSDKFWIATGEVAGAMGEKARDNFDRAVTAWLNSHDPIGVLIIDLQPM